MAKKGADIVIEALKTPVMGFDRTVTYTKKGKTVIETGRFQIRAWELGLGALVGWIWLGGLQGLANTTTGNGSILSPTGSPWNIWDGFISTIISAFSGAGNGPPPAGETSSMGTVGDVLAKAQAQANSVKAASMSQGFTDWLSTGHSF